MICKFCRRQFKTCKRGAELRLIDYGSGTIDDLQKPTPNTTAQCTNVNATTTRTSDDGTDLLTHTTYAGSAFYISPELFQRKYTQRTDIWSAGVTLYVLVAGYPADVLQKAFNMLQKSKNRDLHSLPHMPEGMPDSYFEMLDQMLTYRHKQRKSAGDVLDCEFVRFHKEMEEGGMAEGADDVGLSLEDVAAVAAEGGGRGSTRNGSMGTKSILIKGSVSRHMAYLEYEHFERALTTLLATLLDLDELKVAIAAIDEQLEKEPHVSAHGSLDDTNHDIDALPISNRAKLQVMKVEDIHKLLVEQNYKAAATMVEKLANYSRYQAFAYHVALLRLFVRGKTPKKSGRRGNSVLFLDDESGSSRSSRGGAPNSVHGGNVWQSIKKKPIRRSGSVGDALNRSAPSFDPTQSIQNKK